MSGDVYVGNFEDDECTKGQYNYVDKNTYKGTFIHTDDQILPHGKGEYIFANGGVSKCRCRRDTKWQC